MRGIGVFMFHHRLRALPKSAAKPFKNRIRIRRFAIVAGALVGLLLPMVPNGADAASKFHRSFFQSV